MWSARRPPAVPTSWKCQVRSRFSVIHLDRSRLGFRSLTGRARHFGDWTYVASTSATNPVYEVVGAETFFDLIGNYQFTDNVNVTVGVENAFDNFTQHTGLVTELNNGRLYPRGVPYENEGRQVYARVGIKF